MTLTAERLRELLDYNPETGVFTRQFSTGGQLAGTIAGNTCKDGRVQLYVDGRNHKAHRLAWLWMMGEWPSGVVDHKDGNPSNNRWNNLRDVTHSVNSQNRKGPTSHNSHGFLGVTRNHKRFMAHIKIEGKQTYLGTYDTPEEAHEVYMKHRRELLPGNTL